MSASVSEHERLAALASYDILDTPSEEPFDRIARTMGWAFDVPIAVVAFMDAERLWIKATTGDRSTIPRERSFCIHVVTGDEPLVVEDARTTPRFSENPFVTEQPHVRAYAGVPVRTPEGISLGAVSIYDKTPRSFSEEAVDRLQDFAAMVTKALELRRASLPEPEGRSESKDRSVKRSIDPPSDSSLKVDGLARLTSDGVMRLDPDGRIEWVNERFVEMSGYTLDELRGRHPSRLLHGPATDPEALAHVRRCIEQREPFTQELVNYRKSGAQYWVEVKAEPLFEEETCTGFLVVQTDVTEERHRQDALVALTSFYERALTELPIEVAVMDTEGRYLFLNPAGVGDEELREWLIGKTAVDYARRRGLDPEPFEQRVEWIRTVVEKQESDSFEDAVTTAEGETRHILRVAHPVTDEADEVTRVFAYGVDVTERKEREQKLREAKERAEEMNRLKSAFLANVSHEIRTPLTSIIGFADVLGEEVSGQKSEMAGLIQRSGVRLKQTLTSVLDLARLEGNAMELTPRSHDLVDRIRETVELLRPQIQAHDLSLTLDLPEAPVEIVVDGAAFDRILTNLLTNAIKFTPEGGVRVTLREKEEIVEVAVVDTGIGISESFRQRIFEAFKQESEGIARDYEGIGIGLTITKRLVTLMDGTVQIESTKGEGTTVTVVLPKTASGSGQDEPGKPLG